MSAKISPNRRRSMSVLHQGSSLTSGNQRRGRAYSLAPGEKLSPAAKARRLLVPRKSILKPPPPLQPSPEGSTSNPEDENATETMDFTMHDTTAMRQRRVSFATHAHVRLIAKDSANSKDASSSPEQAQSEDDPGRTLDSMLRSRRRSSRRRSSTAFSEFGEQPMNLDDSTAPSPSQFRSGENFYDDEDFGDGEDFGEDMDLTEAMGQQNHRRSSVALGGNRRRSSTAFIATSSLTHSENQPPSHEFADDSGERLNADQDQDLTTSSTQSQSFTSEGSSGDHTQPMEFTIPMGQALHPPATEDPIWQQLRAATHAGQNDLSSDDIPQDEDETGEPMDLTVAMSRLLEARKSLGLPPPSDPLVGLSSEEDGPHFADGDVDEQPTHDDTFTSTEDGSFGSIDGLGDQTINVTQTLSRASLGQDVTMDVTDVLHAEIQVAPASAPAIPQAAGGTAEPPPSTETQYQMVPSPADPITEPTNVLRVFSAPSPIRPAAPKSPLKQVPEPLANKPFTFSLPRGPVSSSSGLPPSPSKIPVFRGSASPVPSSLHSRKRPAPDSEQSNNGSGAKLPAEQRMPEPPPTKRVKLDAPSIVGPVASQPNRRASSIRRPTGYFAQRKSLGQTSTAAPRPQPPLNRKAPGRMSLGPSVFSSNRLYPDVTEIAKSSLPPPSASPTKKADAKCERELIRQAIASPTPNRGSPSPLTNKTARPGSDGPDADLSPYPALEFSVTSPVASQSEQMSEPHNISGSGKSPTPLAAYPQGANEEVKRQDPTSPAQDWVDDDGEETPTNEESPISIEQFFDMTGLRFMDEITAPRRSIVHPSQMRPRSRRRSLTGSEPDTPEEIPLAEFITAMAVEIPQLELYSTIANQLSGWIDDSRRICQQADEETVKVTPSVFRDFAEADDSDREFLVHQLKLIKANNHGTAKSQWYDWKQNWVGQLRGTAETAFTNLESDATMLESINKEAQKMLPALREEFAQVMKELEQEQADVAEIENCDQDFLAELRTTIAEQDSELESYRADVSEAKAKLSRLEEKLVEIETQKQETTAAISHAQRVIRVQKESTSAEVFKLKAELEALQDLHLWRCNKMDSNVLELDFASRYRVIIPCAEFKLNVAQLQLSQLMVEGARHIAMKVGADVTAREVVQNLGDFWSSCNQLKSQLTFLATKYPLIIETQPVSDGLPALTIRATVMFPSIKSKARISFILSGETYSKWPLSIHSLGVDVDVAYGQVQREPVLAAVSETLAHATPFDNRGCLLDACNYAAGKY